MQTFGTKIWGGVILEGGKAQRLGGRNKGQIKLGTQTLQEIALSKLAPNLPAIALSVGTMICAERAAESPYPQLADKTIDGRPIGPAGGLLAALDWAASLNLAGVATLPVDTPILPENLYAALITKEGPAYATHGGDNHWLHAAWPISVKSEIEAAVLQNHIYALHRLHKLIKSKPVHFPQAPEAAFHNINTPEDLDIAKEHLGHNDVPLAL